MSFESFENQEERDIPQEILGTFMEVQKQVMRKQANPAKGADGFQEWIDKNRATYRNAFLGYLDEHSDVEKQWKDDAKKREEILAEVMAKMNQQAA